MQRLDLNARRRRSASRGSHSMKDGARLLGRPLRGGACLLLVGAAPWAFWLDPEISVVERGRVVAKLATS